MFNTKLTPDQIVGIDDIDQCHQYILGILCEAYDGFAVGLNMEDYIIDEVLCCMSQCFNFEETLMLETSFPRYLEHKHEHEMFTQCLIQGNSCKNGDVNTSIELLFMLNNWICNHITAFDAELGTIIPEK